MQTVFKFIQELYRATNRVGRNIKTRSYHAEVINLSLKDKKMIKKFPVLKCQSRFFGLCKIYTISIPEKDIEDVTNLRQKYRNKLRNCTDDNLIKEYKEKRNECTTILNKYRKNLKIANYILEDTPKVKEVIKIEMQMKNGQDDVTKKKKKDRNLSR